MVLAHRLRALALPSLLILAALVPASAEAAFVTAVDVAVRPAEGSPWSKGTLFRGEGFQVGHTTSTGWAYGRAKGGAERCGWVLISEINSTTRTDDTCGSPKSEPLGDSEHVPGGGPSERWYVTCESATLHGNYGGGPGQLRSEAGTVTRDTALGWRYTTGDGYAASVDGPTGTPRFILRSCISRTPPPGAPGPGPAPEPQPGPAPSDPALGIPAPGPQMPEGEETWARKKQAPCTPDRVIGEARTEKRDGNTIWIPKVGLRTYTVGINSVLYACGGYVYARTIVYVNAMTLPHGFPLVMRVSTRRSDGRWAAAKHRIYKTTRKHPGDFVVDQYRGIGRGLRLTDVHVKHFPHISKGATPIASTAKAKYGAYRGPEAKPGKG